MIEKMHLFDLGWNDQRMRAERFIQEGSASFLCAKNQIVR